MKSQKPKRNINFTALWRESLRAISLGWDLAIPIFGGVLIGYLLDNWLGTTYIFTIGLLFFGIALSYYNLWRFIEKVKRIDEQIKKEAASREDEENGQIK
jgi:F0F1-type ATP synthase assembly protein I